MVTASSGKAAVRRGFIDLDGAQVHYRHAGAAGDRRPLVMVHASPASSLGLVPLIEAMAADRWVVAPDTLGNGDSTGDIPAGADVAFFARRLGEALDALDIGPCDVYGTHTGASIATELALARPRQVRSVVLDGVGLYPDEFRDELLARYAPPLTLDLQGTYLMWVWHFVRDTFMFWPWYRLDRAHRRDAGMPDAAVLHAKVVEVLKAATTYHHSYRAAISYDKRARIPQLQMPALAVCARGDMLHIYFEALQQLVPGGQGSWIEGSQTPEAAAATAAVLRQFIDSHPT